jgi:hypothetical protein
MSQNILLISAEILKERSQIYGNIDPKLIFPEIKIAQDLYILPIIGTALFDKLLESINDNTIKTDTAKIHYKNLLDRYIVDCLMQYTLSGFVLTGSYQIGNKGVRRNSDENTEVPSLNELFDLSNRYKNVAETYAQRLKMYLLSKASLHFPEYLNPGNDIDTVIPDMESFDSPIYLGNSESPFCNPGGFNGQPYKE